MADPKDLSPYANFIRDVLIPFMTRNLAGGKPTPLPGYPGGLRVQMSPETLAARKLMQMRMASGGPRAWQNAQSIADLYSQGYNQYGTFNPFTNQVEGGRGRGGGQGQQLRQPAYIPNPGQMMLGVPQNMAPMDAQMAQYLALMGGYRPR